MGSKLAKPLLSISLLSSGRPDTLWKCLDSLKPILESVHSELVIVDTGCDSATKQKMYTYTGTIIPFTWCNDFAAARNAGLKACKGRWFLYLDDDEWFIETQPIINFFTSGEYKKYDTALYYQRNYLSSSGEFYEDALVSRMKELTPETKFIGRIHEYLDPVRKPGALVPGIVEHHGYIFEDSEKQQQHADRNISLLIQSIEEDPNNLRWYFQLSQEYAAIKDWDNCIDICTRGIELAKDQTHPKIPQYVSYFYACICNCYYISQDHLNCKNFAISALKTGKLLECSIAKISMQLAHEYALAAYWNKAEKALKDYFRLYNKLKDSTVDYIMQGGNYVRDAFLRSTHDIACCIGIQCGCKLKNEQMISEYFNKISWELDPIFLASKTFYYLLDYCVDSEYSEIVQNIFDTLTSNKLPKSMFQKEFNEWYSRLHDEDKKVRVESLKRYIQIDESL